MTGSTVDRRTACRLGGLAGLGALAGCLDLLGEDYDELGALPDYHEHLVAADEEVFFAVVDLTTLEDLEEEGVDLFGVDNDDAETEPLLGALGGAFLLLWVAGWTFEAAGIDDLLEEGDHLNSEVTDIYLVNETVVARGSFDTDELEAAILAPPEEEFLGVEYEADGAIEGYDTYRPADGDGSGIAVHEDTLVALEADLEEAIAMAEGDREPATEEFEDFEWLLGAAEDGDVAFGGYGPDGFDGFDETEADDEDEPTALEDALGSVSSASVTAETVTATTAVVAESIGSEERSEIEDEFEDSQGDVEFEYWDDRALIEGTLDIDDLE